jgi:hypothetical protein
MMGEISPEVRICESGKKDTTESNVVGPSGKPKTRPLVGLSQNLCSSQMAHRDIKHLQQWSFHKLIC